MVDPLMEDMMKDGGIVEGEPSPPYKIYLMDVEGQPYGEALAEFLTIEEVNDWVATRVDCRYCLLHRRKKVEGWVPNRAVSARPRKEKP
jgi:hypothetical protein